MANLRFFDLEGVRISGPGWLEAEAVYPGDFADIIGAHVTQDQAHDNLMRLIDIGEKCNCESLEPQVKFRNYCLEIGLEGLVWWHLSLFEAWECGGEKGGPGRFPAHLMSYPI